MTSNLPTRSQVRDVLDEHATRFVGQATPFIEDAMIEAGYAREDEPEPQAGEVNPLWSKACDDMRAVNENPYLSKHQINDMIGVILERYDITLAKAVAERGGS